MWPPSDPVENIIQGAHQLVLKLIDEDVIVMLGMNSPNHIVTQELDFESLETEPDPNKLRGVARQLRFLYTQFFTAYALSQFRYLKRAH